MTITTTTLYWLVKLDEISSLVKCLAALTTAGLLGIGIALGMAVAGESEGDNTCPFKVKPLKKYSTMLLCVVIPLWIISTLLPTTKQACIIYGVPAVLNSETAQELSKETSEVAILGVRRLKELLDDTEQSKCQ